VEWANDYTYRSNQGPVSEPALWTSSFYQYRHMSTTLGLPVDFSTKRTKPWSRIKC